MRRDIKRVRAAQTNNPNAALACRRGNGTDCIVEPPLHHDPSSPVRMQEQPFTRQNFRGLHMSDKSRPADTIAERNLSNWGGGGGFEAWSLSLQELQTSDRALLVCLACP